MINPGVIFCREKPCEIYKTLDFGDRAENNELGGTTVRLYNMT